MNGLATINQGHLTAMVRNAAQKLASAESAAEVLQARDAGAEVYDQAKRAARLQKAKGAHDTLIMTIYRVQAEGLEIEAAAKRRLADEYDAAQDRGEVQARGGDRAKVPSENFAPATAAQIGVTKKQVHEARQLRDAEAREPGVTKRAIDTLVDQGREPTRAAVRREIIPAKPSPRPLATDQGLWVWGRMLDFERKGILRADPHEILSGMVPHMVADVLRIAPLLRELLEKMESIDEYA